MRHLLKQCRNPNGWFGKLLAWGMNIGHSKMTDWGLNHLSIDTQAVILDIGCGGGGTVRKLATMANQGKVYGIDYSDESVTISKHTNRQLIKQGRVEIQAGSVTSLPYPDDRFDFITAVETHYFWPDLVTNMQEVRRVLKPGGKFVIIGEAYKDGKFEERNQQWVTLGNMAYHSLAEFAALFSSAGYVDVQVFEEYNQGWICGVGCKPNEKHF
jgi:SAM-dependent methyltransferase